MKKCIASILLLLLTTASHAQRKVYTTFEYEGDSLYSAMWEEYAISKKRIAHMTYMPEIYPALLKEVNKKRLMRLRLPVSYKDKKQAVCDKVAKALLRRLQHHSGDYRGEIIQWNYDQRDIVPAFMRSKGHRKILMGLLSTKICMSVYRVDVLDENGFRSKYCVVIRLY